MDMKEIQLKTTHELEALLPTLRSELHSLRFKVSEGQLKTVRDIRKKRLELARILTVLRSRQDTEITTAS